MSIYEHDSRPATPAKGHLQETLGVLPLGRLCQLLVGMSATYLETSGDPDDSVPDFADRPEDVPDSGSGGPESTSA